MWEDLSFWLKGGKKDYLTGHPGKLAVFVERNYLQMKEAEWSVRGHCVSLRVVGGRLWWACDDV